MSTTSVSLPFTDIHPSQTASVVASYRPPLATGTAGAQPANTASATHYAYGEPNPTTPAFINSYDWIQTYLTIHKMSTTSYRYAYILWLVFTLFAVVVGAGHLLGRRTTVMGVIWRKFALRRRTWRKHATVRAIKASNKPHRQPYSLPSNAQLVAFTLLFIAVGALCCVGPDYVSPYTHLWDLKSNLTAPSLARRDITAALDAMHEFERRRPPVASTPTTRQPEYTIPKAWWTAGGRTGIIAFSLFPLVVLFALKAPPFALFALPFTTQMHFDKLAFLHRWSGRLVWFITTIHVATWGVQLGRDKRHGINEGIPWNYVWQYRLFIYGCVGYVLMTLLVILSISPIRTKHYELFYALHVVLVPLTLIFSALHFPSIWHWCWVALALWGCERLFRWARGAWVNGALGPWGSFGSHVGSPTDAPIVEKGGETWEMGVRPQMSASASTFLDDKQTKPEAPELAHYFTPVHGRRFEDDTERDSSVDLAGGKHRPWSMSSDGSYAPRNSLAELIPHRAGQHDQHALSYGPVAGAGVSPSKPFIPPSGESSTIGAHHALSVLPPPGYAHCVLLPGKTLRLTIVTPRPMRWAPGQHVLLCVPSVSRFTTHPFTIAGACDTTSTSVGARGREIALIIRARAGFTRELWEAVVRGSGHHARAEGRPRGVLMRASVDGPFGSAVREKWERYPSAVLIAGGSGVAFALGVLEALCLGIVRGGEGVQTKRIRFVWMIREYAHVQWCASILRRCREMVPNKDVLQIDIFVTNFSSQAPAPDLHSLEVDTDNEGMLAPPVPRFARDAHPRPHSTASNDSLDSALTAQSMADYEYSDGGRPSVPRTATSTTAHTDSEEHGEGEPVDGPEGDLGAHVLDFTNFDGEDDTRTPAEAQLSKRVKKEGRLRRARSRKVAAAVVAKVVLEEKRKSMRPFSFFGGGQNAATGAIAAGAVGAGVGAGAVDDEPLAAPHPRYAHEPGSGASTPGSATPGGTPRVPQSRSGTPDPTVRPPLLNDPVYRSSVASSMFSRGSIFSDSRSVFGAGGMDEPAVEMDDEEAEDVGCVAELARPGKPKLGRILADEVAKAEGEVVVACCGPTSLNAAMRKIVADQLDVGKVWRGDMSGSITLVSEDYEW